jgi:hypothetical protein
MQFQKLRVDFCLDSGPGKAIHDSNRPFRAGMAYMALSRSENVFIQGSITVELLNNVNKHALEYWLKKLSSRTLKVQKTAYRDAIHAHNDFCAKQFVEYSKRRRLPAHHVVAPAPPASATAANPNGIDIDIDDASEASAPISAFASASAPDSASALALDSDKAEAEAKAKATAAKAKAKALASAPPLASAHAPAPDDEHAHATALGSALTPATAPVSDAVVSDRQLRKRQHGAHAPAPAPAPAPAAPASGKKSRFFPEIQTVANIVEVRKRLEMFRSIELFIMSPQICYEKVVTNPNLLRQYNAFR